MAFVLDCFVKAFLTSFRESSISITGPSLTSSTFMCGETAFGDFQRRGEAEMCLWDEKDACNVLLESI